MALPYPRSAPTEHLCQATLGHYVAGLKTPRDEFVQKQLINPVSDSVFGALSYASTRQRTLTTQAVPGQTENLYDTLFASVETQEGEGIPVTL